MTNSNPHSYFGIRTERKGITKVLASIIVLVIVGAAIGGVIFFTSSGQSSSSGANISCGTRANSTAIQVSIPNGASSSSNAPGYSPNTIHIVIGSNNTVTWTNNDGVAHTVTSQSTPSGASFDSGRMGQGATYSCTFTQPGTYQYYCKYHSWMSGTIIVETS